MDENWITLWNEKFGKAEYAYGEEPNSFFKEQLKKLPIGSILLPAEGEGRNGVYAAKLGWEVSAFDISKTAKQKAIMLAENNNVFLKYHLGDLTNAPYETCQFDALGLIYAHFPPSIRIEYHTKLQQFLKPGGTIIIEAFNKKHLSYRSKNPSVGGPGQLDFLFSKEEIKRDFDTFEIKELYETEVILNEGFGHQGKGSVLRFVGTKNDY